jgi:hypothetical protein
MSVYQRKPVFVNEVTKSFPDVETPLRFRYEREDPYSPQGRTDLTIRVVENRINVFSKYKSWAPAFQFNSLESFQEWAQNN